MPYVLINAPWSRQWVCDRGIPCCGFWVQFFGKTNSSAIHVSKEAWQPSSDKLRSSLDKSKAQEFKDWYPFSAFTSVLRIKVVHGCIADLTAQWHIDVVWHWFWGKTSLKWQDANSVLQSTAVQVVTGCSQVICYWCKCGGAHPSQLGNKALILWHVNTEFSL